ncbi:hypothetical protein LC612_36280 [Nostoc sp. CHAB 5834]|nr:hypothetical protein [Nostoc sp. CHAB 5834]
MQPQFFSHFDAQHWAEVKRVRVHDGLPGRQGYGVKVSHPLVGKTLQDQQTGKRWKVESVSKDWWKGDFWSALASNNGSHCTLFIVADKCQDDGIKKSASEFGKRYLVI